MSFKLFISIVFIVSIFVGSTVLNTSFAQRVLLRNIASTDYHAVLGLSVSASDAEIKKAYRRFAMMFHPDRNPGKTEVELDEMEKKFKNIKKAYEILNGDINDPETKSRYSKSSAPSANAYEFKYQDDTHRKVVEYVREYISDNFLVNEISNLKHFRSLEQVNTLRLFVPIFGYDFYYYYSLMLLL